MAKEKGIWCPHHCDIMFITKAEQLTAHKLKVWYRCEYCGCTKVVIYNIQPIKEEWWD